MSKSPDQVDEHRCQLNDKEGEQGPEEKVRDLQAVAGLYRLGVLPQKGGPGLAGWAGLAQWPHVALDGALADPETELEEFSPDPLGAPERILLRHLLDQGHGLAGHRWQAAGGRFPVMPLGGLLSVHGGSGLPWT